MYQVEIKAVDDEIRKQGLAHFANIFQSTLQEKSIFKSLQYLGRNEINFMFGIIFVRACDSKVA